MRQSTLRVLVILYRCVAVVLGAVSAWGWRNFLNPDGVSYLDLGDAMLAGGPAAALNSYWSPLYPLVLMLVRSVSGFSAAVELPMAHLANFLIYLGALAAFELMLREIAAGVEPAAADETAATPSRRPAGHDAVPSAQLCLVGLGYPLFLVCSLELIGLGLVTPDCAVAALAMLAVALVLRLRRTGGEAGTWIALGSVLGLGYLTKTPMLIIGTGILGCGWLLSRDSGSRKALAHAALVFAVIAGAFIVALSARYGRFTAGDSGRLNYAFHVNRVTKFSHAQEDQGEHGRLVHPLNLIHEDPPVYEFAEPIGGTYPPWYDPGYWYEGVRPRFDLAQQVEAIERSWRPLREIATVMRWPGVGLAVVLVVALVTAPGLSWSRIRSAAWSQAFLLSVGLAPVLMYCLVHLDTRYVGGFVLMAALAPVGVALRITGRPRRLAVLGAAVGCLLALTVAWRVADAARRGPGDNQYRLAVALHRLGVEPGDPVGIIGNAYRANWARLGRLQIVADIPKKHVKQFRSATDTQQQRALDAFARVGARAVVTESAKTLPAPWTRVNGSSHWAALL